MVAQFEVRDAAFQRLVPDGAAVQRIAGGFGFTEGPVWTGDALLFSDIPNDRIVRWRALPEGPEVMTFRSPACQPVGAARSGTNGLTLDAEGRLLACEHGGRRVSRTEADGSVVAVAERFDGKRLNSPNDVVARPDGSAYFTDPPFALPSQSEGKELPFNAVFHLAPDGALTPVVDDFERPNGLAISLDGRVLYVDDTARGHIRAFDLRDDGSVGNGRVFADIRAEERGVPDGMKLDAEGNVWCTGAGGVWVIAPTGAVLGRILMPEVTANLAWGGEGNHTLFLTASTSVYRLTCGVAGQPLSAV